MTPNIFMPTLSNNFLINLLSQNYSEFSQKGTVSLEKITHDSPLEFKISIKEVPKYILRLIPQSQQNDLFEHSISELLEHLQASEQSYLYQKNVKNLKGQSLTKFSYLFKDYYIRIISYLNSSFRGNLFHNLGTTLGKQTLILEFFPHTCQMMVPNNKLDLKNFLFLQENVSLVQNLELRRISKYFLMKFNQKVLPVMHELRMQVIQGDFDEKNILVDSQNVTQISGIVDFNSMIYTHTIFQLAIAIAYSILMNPLHIQQTSYDLIQHYNEQFPLKILEIDILYWLVGARLSTIAILNATDDLKNHSKQLLSQLEKTLRQYYRINPLHFTNSARILCEQNPLYTDDSIKSYHSYQLQERAKIMPKTLSICYQKPLNLTQGIYQYIFDDQGRTYVDCANNVQHVGHSHPDIARIASEQYSTLNINTRYINPYLLEYCQELSSKFPEPLKYVFLVNSGTEANELALRLARTYTKSKETIVMEHGYHGNSNSIVEISHYKYSRKGGQGPESYIHSIPIPDPLRSQHLDYNEIIQSILKEIKDEGKQIGAFICESIISLGGYIIPPNNFFKTIYQHVRKAGGVCIADEVQVGFGRVGSKFWAFELQDVVPDIVTMGKPIANGHPMGAVITTKEIADAFNNGMEYFNTFSGTQVSCRIALEVLKILKEEKLQENARVVGSYFKEKLRSIKSYLIADVRGEGLFIGMELVNKKGFPGVEETKKLNEKLKEKGVFVGIDGYLYNVLKIKPSLCITKEDIDFIVEQFEKSLVEIEKEDLTEISSPVRIQPKAQEYKKIPYQYHYLQSMQANRQYEQANYVNLSQKLNNESEKFQENGYVQNGNNHKQYTNNIPISNSEQSQKYFPVNSQEQNMNFQQMQSLQNSQVKQTLSAFQQSNQQNMSEQKKLAKSLVQNSSLFS